ncbi:MAG TPA: hypothetical protein VG276_15390 [Actinomycetes bacterium]|nr:hypothetical protein [Actinomycetes bacterium]
MIGWKDQLPVLAKEHTVYVVDLPGRGYTELLQPPQHLGCDDPHLLRASVTGTPSSVLSTSGRRYPLLVSSNPSS